MPILKIIGILMMMFVLAIGGYLFVNASSLQEEIEAERQNQSRDHGK